MCVNVAIKQTSAIVMYIFLCEPTSLLRRKQKSVIKLIPPLLNLVNQIGKINTV